MVEAKFARVLTCCLFLLAAMLTLTEAYPRTRRVHNFSRRGFGSVENSIRNNLPSCERNVPCGWALYHQRWRSALRPIFEYTKNTFCSCDLGSQCVYKENQSEMRAYVFYCRPEEESRDLYRFPSTT